MPKRAHDPGDEAGRLDPSALTGPNPPSRGQVSSGDADAEAEVNFDDDEIYSGTGDNTRRGGTSKSAGADSGVLGPPSEQWSDSNRPWEKNANVTR